MDRICPSLANVGPSSSSASRNRRARAAVSSWPRCRTSPRPYLPKTWATCAARPSSWPSVVARRLPARSARRGRARGAGHRGIHDHHRAPGVVRHPVGNAAEQELGAVAHADVADHDQVDALLLAGPDDGARPGRSRRPPAAGRGPRRPPGSAPPARPLLPARRLSASEPVRCSGGITWRTSSSAAYRPDISAAHATARVAVSDWSVATRIRSITVPPPCYVRQRLCKTQAKAQHNYS